MCTVHDSEPQLARLPLLRKSQINRLLDTPTRAAADRGHHLICSAWYSSAVRADQHAITAPPFFCNPLRTIRFPRSKRQIYPFSDSTDYRNRPVRTSAVPKSRLLARWVAGRVRGSNLQPAFEGDRAHPAAAAHACCGVVRNDCCDVSAPRGAVFNRALALSAPKPAIACTS
jgi:hypothetical protein